MDVHDINIVTVTEAAERIAKAAKERQKQLGGNADKVRTLFNASDAYAVYAYLPRLSELIRRVLNWQYCNIETLPDDEFDKCHRDFDTLREYVLGIEKEVEACDG